MATMFMFVVPTIASEEAEFRQQMEERRSSVTVTDKPR